MLTLKQIKLNLIDYLPEWQKHFYETKSYDDLAIATYKLLISQNFEIEKQAFLHTYENFLHLCEKDPSGIAKKNSIKQSIDSEKKEKDLKEKLEEYLNHIRSYVIVDK